MGAVLLLRRISGSVGLAPPTLAMLAEENPRRKSALFRNLPDLAEKFAWRSLGAMDKTPIHTLRIPVPSSGGESEVQLEFYVKREDLISPLYGGNKVRTLQHQLAVCESRRERGEQSFRQLVSAGTGGSNQVIATVVHARALGWDGSGADAPRINVCWLDKDEPDMDNTLNLLSVLSFPNIGFKVDWGDSRVTSPGMSLIRGMYGAWTQTEYVPMMPGGNSPSGVLGQVGGLLELAEQIVAGESPDPSRIYVPIGSGCTISGLILGTVLVRHLGMAALSDPDFLIVGANVHPKFAQMDRGVNLHLNPLFGFLPLTVTHTVKEACRALKRLGGPDLEREAMAFIRTSVEMRAEEDVVGAYGAHSEPTRAVAKRYDEKGVVLDYSTGEPAEKKLWVCGHFVSKAFQPLLKDLQEELQLDHKTGGKNGTQPKFMLWMTKSAVQPRGNVDEWSKLLQENDIVQQWANDGKAESTLRPGRVSTVDGNPEDYRSVMTKIL
jgi:1-aminocyclopropane-1-carboxylate deaminase/D-cysteine desulfhydrase-like pyridoxal-dependent ACC family enzyme